MEKLAILGSTGSIGKQVLSVVDRYPDRFCVQSLTANSQAEEFERQINKYKPAVCGLTDSAYAEKIKEIPNGTKLYLGENALLHAVENADTVVVAVTGFAGFKAVKYALERGKKVALANKESLVAGGEVLTAIKTGELVPIDSEHSAIWQCLNFDRYKPFKEILLTASGGAFRTMPKEEIAEMPAQRALMHPTWKMGKKITIDCATMMNKGLEVIEARWLFNCNLNQIKVVVHPQSVIHSMVSFADGSTIAQLGYPSMEIPIQLALTYPERLPCIQSFDFYGKSLTFEKLDTDKFPCFDLAIRSLKEGGNMPCAMNAANEQAVELYLKGIIKFYDIAKAIEFVLDKTEKTAKVDVDVLVNTDFVSRLAVKRLFGVEK